MKTGENGELGSQRTSFVALILARDTFSFLFLKSQKKQSKCLQLLLAKLLPQTAGSEMCQSFAGVI